MNIRWSWILLAQLCFSVAVLPEAFAAKRKMTAGQFPMFVGSRWVYTVDDSVGGHRDTVHVRIVGMTDFPGGKRAGVWEYRSSASTDTQYVVRAGDTISFYRSKSASSVVAVFVFPILPGRKWTISPRGTTEATRTLTAVVPAGKFCRSFEVVSRPNLPNFMGGTTYTLAPRVGIVRKHTASVYTISDEHENTSWRLLSWKISK